MNIYTVSFFGHREIENPIEIENRLDKILHDLISQREYVEFLIGRDGEFDLLASSVIKRNIRNYGYGNTYFILVLPYMKTEYRDNEKDYLDYYDEVEICTESANAHYKAAIQIRNRNMVDRSNLVVCCIQHKSGGAFKAVQYAEKQNCRIINLAKGTE
ncbi:MAG: hypothetical protein K2I06_06640 [Ruminococcus sp.]|nr:hypothetical protein [Ruminococcus sp.]